MNAAVLCWQAAFSKSFGVCTALPLSDKTRNSANQSLGKKLRSSILGLVELIVSLILVSCGFRNVLFPYPLLSWVMRLATQQSTGSFEEPRAPPVHQLLDVLTTSAGRDLCQMEQGMERRPPGKRVWWRHQAQTGKRQQHLCTYLEVLPKMGSPLEKGKLSSTPGTACSGPYPFLPQLLPHRKGSQFPGGWSYLN